MSYNCLYLNKGNNSSVKGSILTKLIGYPEFMVLIICTKNELNLTNRYWDMVPDRQKVRMDGRNGRTDDAKTISLRLRRGITTQSKCVASGETLLLPHTYIFLYILGAHSRKSDPKWPSFNCLVFQTVHSELWPHFVETTSFTLR